MNVVEINSGSLETLAAYVESTVILTVITAWAMVALQEHSSFHPGGRDFLKRVAWPVFYGYSLIQRMTKSVKSFLARRQATAG